MAGSSVNTNVNALAAIQSLGDISRGLTTTQSRIQSGLKVSQASDDPAVFTRPWKIKMPLYRRIDKPVQVLESKCVEFAEELLYGHLRKKPAGK